MMLYFRVDGNAEIGTGHVMRCISIAKAATIKGYKCIFITADTEMHPTIRAFGFDVICLDAVWNDLDQETEKICVLIKEYKIKKLLVDSYFVTPTYLSALYALAYVIYIDDLDAFHYPCNALLNYNIYADRLDYPSRYPNTKLFLGPKYAPLREEFQKLPKRQACKIVQKVLITTGGSDPYNVAANLMRVAMRHLQLKLLDYHVVSGRFNNYLPELLSLQRQHSNIVIHNNVQNMAELMMDCDIAVSAAGSTLYELCACSLPTVTFVLADNQIKGAEEFNRLRLMPYAGDVRNNLFSCLDVICEQLCEMESDLVFTNKTINCMTKLMCPQSMAYRYTQVFSN